MIDNRALKLIFRDISSCNRIYNGKIIFTFHQQITRIYMIVQGK